MTLTNEKPRLLDLYSGAGGAARGYQLAGFHVTGVDIAPQPNYCGDEFIQSDALEFLRLGRHASRSILRDFSAIHSSPPCQGYTNMNNRWGSDSPLLIEATREAIQSFGLPYVIENVSGAKRHLRNPIELTGEMFGLGVHRPRLFECVPFVLSPPRPTRQLEPVAVYGKQDGRRLWTRIDGSELHVANLEDASEAMGVDWMTWDELREAIPPAYTRYVGEQLLNAISPDVVPQESKPESPNAKNLSLGVIPHD